MAGVNRKGWNWSGVPQRAAWYKRPTVLYGAAVTALLAVALLVHALQWLGVIGHG